MKPYLKSLFTLSIILLSQMGFAFPQTKLSAQKQITKAEQLSSVLAQSIGRDLTTEESQALALQVNKIEEAKLNSASVIKVSDNDSDLR